MEWSTRQLAALTGVTSRTLRHYDAIGLLPPARTGANGYRRYADSDLIRLQRILLLRDLGLGLTEIGRVLAREVDAAEALGTHLDLLAEERDRLDRRIAAVRRTLTTLTEGAPLMPETMFDGFDHTRHRDEVEARWGREAYARSDAWWRGMTEADRAAWKENLASLGRDWISAAERGILPTSAEAQALAERHIAWLTGIPGTPAADPQADTRAYVLGLAELYVADPRFAANYGGESGASFVRDALRAYYG